MNKYLKGTMEYVFCSILLVAFIVYIYTMFRIGHYNSSARPFFDFVDNVFNLI